MSSVKRTSSSAALGLAAVLLAPGARADVLDVPAAAGLAALAMMQDAGVDTGPVAVGSGRTQFFVATRGAPDNEDEWWSCHLDCAPEDVREVVSLRWHCRNSYVLAPPSRDAAGLAARWISAPGGAGPSALPDAVRLLEFLADACEEGAAFR